MLASSSGLVRYMAENPGAVFETVASEFDVTPRAAVEALPAEMRRLAPGEAFVDAMGDIAKWGDVTLIVHTDDGIMEFTGPVPGRPDRAWLLQCDGFDRVPRPLAARALRGAGVHRAAIHGQDCRR